MYFNRLFLNTKTIKVLQNSNGFIQTKSILSTNLNSIHYFKGARLSSLRKIGLCYAKTMERGMTTDEQINKKFRNRLANEKSPYLLQHSTNPVNWYPWGDEAFAKAQNENKLIFLSVGYSTCHWCHVMERESFENQNVAEIMNEYFVNIKVDREERPDVDRIYMQFVQASTQHGGWPMSVFLTPDLKPISGGTYFPPDEGHNLPSFKSVLLTMAQQWLEHHSQMSKAATKITELLEQTTKFDVPIAGRIIDGNVPDSEVWDKCQEQIYDKYEPMYGGFSKAPKFPRASFIKLLFHRHARLPNEVHGVRSKAMALHTLDCIAMGGIHDHLGQGFARYSVDHKWHVPHFEKMLYDQAQLAVAYALAYQITKDDNYEYVIRDILSYVSRDLSHTEGGFFSAEDADSQESQSDPVKKEGAYYTWDYDEIHGILKKPLNSKPQFTQGDVICFHYGVKQTGNVPKECDVKGELIGKNVLAIKHKPSETCDKFEIEFDELKTVLKESKEILYKERLKRPRPHLDDKIITGWNGLMISGFAKASFVLDDESYKNKAIAAAEFVKKYLYNPINKKLLRSCYADGKSIAQLTKPIEGFQNDYAFMIQGLLDLYECTLNEKWIIWAHELQLMQDELFWDYGYAGYFSTTSNDHNIFRFKDDQDGAEPSGNSVAANNLLRLGTILDDDEMKHKASQILSSFSGRLTEVPIAIPELVIALLIYHDSPIQVVITGKLESSETTSLMSVLRKVHVPGLVLMLANDENHYLNSKNNAIKKMKPQNGKQAAYLCRGHACTLPLTSPEDLASQIKV